MQRCLIALILLFSFSLGALEDDFQAVSKAVGESLNEEIAPLAELRGEPSAFVDGCVNAITGNWCEHQVDCIIPGPRPLTLERYYNSGDPFRSSLHHGWSLNHHGKMFYYHVMGEDYYHAKLEDAFKGTIFFKGNKKNKDSHKNIILSLNSSLLNKGVTNIGSGHISGRTNIKNSNVRYAYSEGFLKNCDGTTKLFDKKSSSGERRLLTKQKFLSGDEIDYTYFDRKYIKNIVSKGPEKDLWSSYYFDNLDSDKFKKKKYLDVYTSDGREINYRFYKQNDAVKHKDAFFLNEVDTPLHPKQKYFYRDGSHQIIRKEEPEGRFQEIEYYHKKNNDVGGRQVYVKSEKEPEYHRVKMLKAPVGVDDTPITTHRFFYNLRTDKKKNGFKKALGGSTEVRDALNHKTVYSFSDEYRLTQIKKYTSSRKLYSTEQLVWGEKGSQDEGNLITRELLDASGNAVFSRSYVYDAMGNVLEECLSGNLTGRRDGDSEFFVKKSVYNADNLVISEDDGFKRITYSYKPGTDWLTSKLVWSGGNIRIREFYTHDKNGVVKRKIVDDGHSADPGDLSDVTERKITKYSPRKTAPVGLPDSVEEFYYDLDTKQEVLLKRIENTYSDTGQLLEQKVFDANGEFAASQIWEYDSYGNVIREVDASGNTIIRKYDANGNKVFEQGPDLRLTKYYTYDFSNRLIKEEEKADDGAIRTCSYAYDYLGNKISSIDHLGNETRTEYDAFSRPIKTVKPPIVSEEGNVMNPTEYVSYDILGNAVSIVDANGHETLKKFTILNKPCEVLYPDGTKECTIYNLDGTVAEKIGCDGVRTVYSYDFQNRVTKEEIFDPEGGSLSCRFWTYDAFHILSETDPEGNKTVYDYDGAGRLICKSNGDRSTEYRYDALGRESEIIEYYNESEFRKKIVLYDQLDRVVEERTESMDGETLSQTSYDYDACGRRIAVYHHASNGVSCIKTSYDAFGRIIGTSRPDGSETITIYRDDFFAEPGCRVECIEEIDPNGILTRRILDASGGLSAEEVIDPFGNLVKSVRYYCDGVGNVLERSEDVIVGEKIKHTVTTKYSYDLRDREIEVIEAYGEPEQKITRKEYTSFGEVSKVFKPDGKVLVHCYDFLKRLSELVSSDGSVHYSYTYDLNNNLLKVDDAVNQTTTERTFDGNNQLVEEFLANGLWMSYAHDRLGRLKKVVLPDKTVIHYDHGPAHLRSVSREKERKYVHRYHYDLSGKVVHEETAIPECCIARAYDSSQRPIDISSRYWSERMDEDSWGPADCLKHVQYNDSIGDTHASYTYDGLYQLTSEEGVHDHFYCFDSVYNRIKKDNDDYHVNALNQLLARISHTISCEGGQEQQVCSYSYDDNGNLCEIAKDSEAIVCDYDALDRLVAVTSGSNREEYTYDAFHRRLSKTHCRKVSGTWQEVKKERYFYQGQHEIGSADEKGRIQEMRVIGIGCEGEIGSAVLLELGDRVYVPFHDHRGNVVTIVNTATEAVEECCRYSAYGEESLYDGAGKALEASVNPWRFSSKRIDPLTGWVYFGRRYYDPAVGRWTTPDPEFFVDGPNLYCYVRNQPLIYIDPDGTSLFGALGKLLEGVKIPLFETQVSSPALGASTYTSHVHGRTSANSCLDGYKEDYDGVGYSFINGIWNTRQEAFQSAGMISSMNGGYNVRWTWNASHGMWDLAECILGRQGVHTRPVDLLKENWNGYFDKATERSILIHVCHSQGVIHTRNALKTYDEDLRKRIYVIAVSPGVFIEKKLCGGVVHLVSKRDAIPWTDATGMMANRENVVLLSPHKDAPLFDHSFQSPTFRRPIQEYMDYFKNEYGPNK